MSADDLHKLVWIDLETSGTDETQDDILEVGLILTEGHDTIDMRQWLIEPFAWDDVKESMDPFVLNMHTENGLIDDMDSGMGLPARQVEEDILNMLNKHWPGETKFALAGSGVGHFDRRFLAVHMPTLTERLTYWSVDVGVIRRFFRACAVDHGWPGADAKTHRALDDIRHHLAEYRWAQNVVSDWVDLEIDAEETVT